MLSTLGMRLLLPWSMTIVYARSRSTCSGDIGSTTRLRLAGGFLIVAAGLVGMRFHSTALPRTADTMASVLPTAPSPTPSAFKSDLNCWSSSGLCASVDRGTFPRRGRTWRFHRVAWTFRVFGASSTWAYFSRYSIPKCSSVCVEALRTWVLVRFATRTAASKSRASRLVSNVRLRGLVWPLS